MDNVLSFVLARLREPSTWVAISALLAAFHVSPDLIHSFVGIAMAACAAAGAVMPEGK